MSPEKQWRVILVHLGWRCLQACHTENGLVMYGIPPAPEGCAKNTTSVEASHFLSDLNAMHEAELWLSEYTALSGCYLTLLRDLVLEDDERENWNPCTILFMVRATAAVRAEAFLRAIGKWEDAQ